MILVILGTQDKKFPRLLDCIEKEIEKGTIKDKVVVQAGQTDYTSSNMEIFDLLPAPEFDKMMDKADLIITHGGAGSILSAIKKGKKVIAVPRLAKYHEHHNDHQKQIIHEFAKQGYILELKDFEKLGKLIEKSKTFKPKKFESNTSNMVKKLEDYIEEINHTAWYHKYYKMISSLFLGSCITLMNTLSFYFLCLFKVPLYTSIIFASLVSILFAIMFKQIKFKKIFIFLLYLIYLGIDLGFFSIFINLLSMNEVVAKLISNVIILLVHYLFTKLIIYKKKGNIYEE